ncbi:transcriptional regulator of acetoin/glycerol metabolism [Rhizobium petrolearium]|uniref:helix-turn-helix domain-containing protein n=1 Tax=Neorhizobium petrolearium TaxID=515361 RepID=UPI001AE7753D|nr:helix-turn-helix domain-containing protein [Neorhizobium petrolearium]MBP1844271.1 transcriptional regulator of acetoin/glycerol metabolism [Neorhizobium petrolearium]
MNQHVTHANQVYASAQSAAASSRVVASWRRCMTMHRLSPEEKRLPIRLTEEELRLARERSGKLVAHATGELDLLFQTVGRAGCCLLLTDRGGIALERRGVAGDDKDFHDIGLWTGSIWSEASIGTNGIGTAIADERSVSIIRDQHFFASTTNLSCTTAPIRDHRAQLVGALDVSTCRDDINEITLSIISQTVREAAMRIELQLFCSAFAAARFIVVPTESSAVSALLAVDGNDMVIGATRAARLALDIDDQRIAGGMPASDLLDEEANPEQEGLRGAERAALLRALSRTNGNVSQAAISLGMSRATLHRKIKRLGLH